MVDSLFRLLHSLVRSFSLLWKPITQSWLFQTSGVEVNLVENGTGLEVEKTTFVLIALYSRLKLDLSNREILLMILLLLRTSGTILFSWFRGLTEVFSRLSQYLVKNKYAAPGKVAITGASNGGELTPSSYFHSGDDLTMMKYRFSCLWFCSPGTWGNVWGCDCRRWCRRPPQGNWVSQHSLFDL